MRHIEDVKVTVGSRRFALPARYAREVEAFVASRLQKAALEKSISAEKVLPELSDDTLRPAAMLRGARHKAGLTQKVLAAELDIHQHHLSEMEHGKRPIGKQMAKRLAEVLDSDYRLFL